MGFQRVLNPRDAEYGEDIPEYLKDEHGNKRKFEPCVVDKTAFKRRMIERKVNGAARKA